MTCRELCPGRLDRPDQRCYLPEGHGVATGELARGSRTYRWEIDHLIRLSPYTWLTWFDSERRDTGFKVHSLTANQVRRSGYPLDRQETS